MDEIYTTEDLIELAEVGNFGLRRSAWKITLQQIRELPETYERTYPWPLQPGEEDQTHE
jgi:hypothetical protein